MKRKLYSNIRRMTSFFSVAIVFVTLTSLTLRLTVFSDMAVAAGEPEPVTAVVDNEPSGLLNYTISRMVYIETPTSPGSFHISNPAENEHYITVSIIDPQTEENLLYTGFVRPGQSIEQMRLNAELSQGVYELTAVVTAFDPETLSPAGREERDFTLYVGVKMK